MQAKLYNQDGKEAGTIEVSDAIFNVPWNSALVRQVVEIERANRRSPVAHTKIRSEIRGGGKKPWKQKGTGRARHGSIRSPLWRGGGTTFGPRNERDFSKKLNRKMKRKALFAALSAKLRDGEIFFVNEFVFENPKTKDFSRVMKRFSADGKSLGLVNAGDPGLERIARNIRRLAVFSAVSLNALDLLSKKYIFFPKTALSVVERTFLKK